MFVIVTYDVATESEGGPKRLRKLAKACEGNGIRVQKSVFECDLSPDQWVPFKNKLLAIYDPAVDSIRMYHLGSNWERKVEHHGVTPVFDHKETLIV